MELLVVIAIIGVLAGLVTGAALIARTRAKIAVVVIDLKKMEAGCQAYKERLGEYPPGANSGATLQRHLSKAFPRSTVSLSAAQASDNIVYLSNPFTALTFWLGGMWDDTNKRFIGFSADPTNPFDRTSPSRIGPFFEFDVSRLARVNDASGNPIIMTLRNSAGTVLGTTYVYYYWPQGAAGDKATGAIAYFRADNGAYTTAQAWVQSNNSNPANMLCPYPAIDTRLSNVPTTYVWINPKSFQIFSAGLDCFYAPLRNVTYLTQCLAFPTGENYQVDSSGASTFDDITNFSGGTLESAIP